MHGKHAHRTQLPAALHMAQWGQQHRCRQQQLIPNTSTTMAKIASAKGSSLWKKHFTALPHDPLAVMRGVVVVTLHWGALEKGAAAPSDVVHPASHAHTHTAPAPHVTDPCTQVDDAGVTTVLGVVEGDTPEEGAADGVG